MRPGMLVVLGILSFASVAAQAEKAPQLEKLKTGILPEGGFYTIYAVECGDNLTSSVASSQRRTRWCTSDDGQLECFRSAQEASRRACYGGSIADAGPISQAR
jgi:hypothetical protein